MATEKKNLRDMRYIWGRARAISAIQGSYASDPGNSRCLDGSAHKNCWGTYLHGIFENDRLQEGGHQPTQGTERSCPSGGFDLLRQIEGRGPDRLASVVREHLDMDLHPENSSL